jgi:hypothetical protein
VPGGKVTTFDTFMSPHIQTLKKPNESGLIVEIASTAAEIVGLSDALLYPRQNPEIGDQAGYEYRLAWTRTYSKRCKLLENSSRGSGPFLRGWSKECCASLVLFR